MCSNINRMFKGRSYSFMSRQIHLYGITANNKGFV